MNQSFKLLMQIRERCPIKTTISQLNTIVHQNVAEIFGIAENFEENLEPIGYWTTSIETREGSSELPSSGS